MNVLDATTVPPHSPVVVAVKGHEFHHGTLRSAHNGWIFVDTDRGTCKIQADNPHIQVTYKGRVLGFIDPDPILPTGTPDLE